MHGQNHIKKMSSVYSTCPADHIS